MPYKVIIYNDDKFKMNLKSDRPISAAKKAKKYNKMTINGRKGL